MTETLIKRIWLALIGITAACFLWILVSFTSQLTSYLKLSASAPAEILDWVPKEIRPETYHSVVNYCFELNGDILEGEYNFQKPIFKTEAAAIETIEKFQERPWNIYFNPKNPQEAALQKMFPIKSGIHLLLSLAVLLYFYWFKHYLSRYFAPVDAADDANRA